MANYHSLLKIIPLLLLSMQAVSNVTPIYPSLLNTFESIQTNDQFYCQKETENIARPLVEICLEDICGDPESSNPNLITSENIKKFIKPNYIKELENRKSDLKKIIQKRNDEMLKSIDHAIEDLNKLTIDLENQSSQQIINNFIKIKFSNDKYILSISPTLYESGILTKREFDQFEELIKSNPGLQKNFAYIYGNDLTGNSIPEESPLSLKNRCTVLKGFDLKCREKSSNMELINHDVQKDFTSHKVKRENNLTKETVLDNFKKISSNIELITDVKLKQKILELENNPSNLDVAEYLRVEEDFIGNIFPTNSENFDFGFDSDPKIIPYTESIKNLVDPLKIISKLKQTKKEISKLDIEKQFDDLKIDYLTFEQQAYRNEIFKGHKEKLKGYLEQFLEKIKKKYSSKSFDIIKKKSKELIINTETPSFDWFNLKLRGWLKHELDSDMELLKIFKNKNAMQLDLDVAATTNPNRIDNYFLNATSILVGLNDTESLGIESTLNYPLTDQYMQSENTLTASTHTCSDHRDAKGIFFHELGHFLSSTINSNKSAISKNSYQTTIQERKCITSQYLKYPGESNLKRDSSPHYYEGDSLFTEEDFADYISSSLQKGVKGSSFCSLLDLTRDNIGNIFYSDKNFQMTVTSNDPHSTALKRIIFDVIQRGNEIPMSCQKIMQEHLEDFDFTGCTNKL